MSKTHFAFENRSWNVWSGFGHYAGLIEFQSMVFALHTDGVGTKIIVGQLMKKFDTLGIDCVAMNVNDVICVGAALVGFLDYIALKKPDSYLVSTSERINKRSKGIPSCNSWRGDCNSSRSSLVKKKKIHLIS